MNKFINKVIQGDCLEKLKELPTDSVDCVVTDPPYGYSFMGKDWDRAVPRVEVWKECLRVLKPGAFAFIMSAPRQDVLSQMIVRVTEAGFDTDYTSLYWTYASGFPKEMNIGKMVDKRRWGSEMMNIRKYLKSVIDESGVSHKRIKEHLGIDQKSGVVSNWTVTDSGASVPANDEWLKLKEILPIDDRYDHLILSVEREVTGTRELPAQPGFASTVYGEKGGQYINYQDTVSATDQAKALDGSYGGFQPKPAVEVIIVAMKPLSEKTYVDQALKNGKGITWLDDARIPTSELTPRNNIKNREEEGYEGGWKPALLEPDNRGRFPANLLVSDDVLNGGQEYSRYFDLDAWAKTLPFLICPKASKSEKNRGLEGFDTKQVTGGGGGIGDYLEDVDSASGKYGSEKAPSKNFHPTVKPLKLMSYLITLGSREGDTILDPFAGSCTTCVAAQELKRNYIGIEREKEYVKICEARLTIAQPTLI